MGIFSCRPSLRHPSWPLFFTFSPSTEPFLLIVSAPQFWKDWPWPRKFKKFCLMPTSLVFKFLKDRWHYLFHPAPLLRRRKLPSTWLELVCCEVCIQLCLQRTNSKSERACPSLSVKFKHLTGTVFLQWICTMSCYRVWRNMPWGGSRWPCLPVYSLAVWKEFRHASPKYFRSQLTRHQFAWPPGKIYLLQMSLASPLPILKRFLKH